MRKKGHHVASKSQHSLGHAVDFRIVLPDEAQREDPPPPPGTKERRKRPKGMEPRLVEQEIRDLGWAGGVGTYPLWDDWFVHADVGPLRRWDGT